MFSRNHKIHDYLIIALLSLLVLGQSLAVVHGVAHQNVSKIAVQKSSKGEHHHNSHDCVLCSAFSFQNNLSLFNFASFALFCLVITTFFLVVNQAKSLHFKNINPTRAPPYFS